MPTKRITDLTNYTSILPYSSELFGIYQPLLGWKSKRLEERFDTGLANDKISVLNKLKNEFNGLVEVTYKAGKPIKINVKPGTLISGNLQRHNSLVLMEISNNLPRYEVYKPTI